MKRDIFLSIIKKEPDNDDQRYIFMTDRSGLAENITLASYNSVLIGEMEGCFHSVEEFEDWAASPGADCRSKYVYVLCGSKKNNDLLEACLKDQYMKYMQGWHLFKSKGLDRNEKDAVNKIWEIIDKFVEDNKIPELEDSDQSIYLPRLSQIEEKEAEWLVSGYIPKGQVTALAGDGGSGKTTLYCEIAASLSAGRMCSLEKGLLEGSGNFIADPKPIRVVIFSGEETASHVLKRKLREHGANEDNIFIMDVENEDITKCKFTSQTLRQTLIKYKPGLVIFDPIQAFTSKGITLSDRSAVRGDVIHVSNLGATTDFATLLAVHCNKKNGAWGRKRMADSADIWDIARSVLMIGEADEKGTRYVSQEKCSYGPKSATMLFSLGDGLIRREGTTTKRDRDFVLASIRQATAETNSPQQEGAREFILDFLEGESPQKVSDLDAAAKNNGISANAIKAAKRFLKESGKIRIYSVGFKPKTWMIDLLVPSST